MIIDNGSDRHKRIREQWKKEHRKEAWVDGLMGLFLLFLVLMIVVSFATEGFSKTIEHIFWGVVGAAALTVLFGGSRR